MLFIAVQLIDSTFCIVAVAIVVVAFVMIAFTLFALSHAHSDYIRRHTVVAAACLALWSIAFRIEVTLFAFHFYILWAVICQSH